MSLISLSITIPINSIKYLLFILILCIDINIVYIPITGERAWKDICDRLRRPFYLCRVDHVRKIRDRKHREAMEKYSFVNKTIINWNQLPAEALGT
jgi:hypothetical protein